MYMVLIKIHGFENFMLIHKIYDKSVIQKACEIFKIKSLVKDEILFRQAEKSDFFYGLISGSIGFYKVKYIYIKKNEENMEVVLSKQEYQNLSVSQQKNYLKRQVKELISIKYRGDFFGDIEVYYHKNRKYNAIALENSEVMYLNSSDFVNCFGVNNF